MDAVRKRPRGAKYRNLTARGGVIYFERVAGGRRICFSRRRDDWNVRGHVEDRP